MRPRQAVLLYLNLLANPASSDRFRKAENPEHAAILLCRLWIEDIYVPGIRNLDGLKSDRSPVSVEAFESSFSSRELELLYQFHRFMELRLEMLPKRVPRERSFPDGDFWQNIFRHAGNLLEEIDPDRLELDEILEQQTSHSDLGAYLRHHLLGDL